MKALHPGSMKTHLVPITEAEGLTLAGEVTEVEGGNGKGADAFDRRPQLAAALAPARQLKCAVVVAKLDRLSRDVAFIFGLMALPSLPAMPIPLCCTSMPRWLRRSGA